MKRPLKRMVQLCAMALLFALSLTMATSCNNGKSKAEKAAIEKAKEYAMSPDNAEVEVIYSGLDTVPYYLMDNMLTMTDKHIEHTKSWSSDKNEILENDREEIRAAYQSYKANPNVAYVTCVEMRENTPLGTNKERLVVICDKDNPENILGIMNADYQYRHRYYTLRSVCERYSIEKNEYGKIKTDGMNEIEKFIEI